jgi:GNAT superfamily N-acetyltransferase
MTLQDERLDRLARAELAFAAFNAHRTSAAPDAAIELGETGPWMHVSDPSRPQHPYYNRALAARVRSLAPEALDALPSAVVAIELRPAELAAELADALLERGFRPRGTLCYLGAPAARQPGPRFHAVERLTPAQVDLFLDALESAGTPFPPERRAAKRAFYCTEHFHAYVARSPQGEIAGWATMFVHEGSAFLGNAYVPPPGRDRGVHTALLVARLDAAADAGLDEVFTDVEHGSKSHGNCERVGLRTLAVNTIWQRD